MKLERRDRVSRRSKVELFEEIRREHEFGVGTIQGVSRKLGGASADGEADPG